MKRRKKDYGGFYHLLVAIKTKKVICFIKQVVLLLLNLILLDIYQLKQEISALEELSRQLFLEAHDTHNDLERIEWSKTWSGKYFNFLGYFFSLYCMWKIFIVSDIFLVI